MTRWTDRLATWARAVMACTFMALCAACAGTSLLDPSPDGRGMARTPTGASITPQAAMEAVTLGKTTKSELASALGQAIAIPFDSGYEVWVYRWPGADRSTRAATELVVLFEPGGVATKVRVRQGVAAKD